MGELIKGRERSINSIVLLSNGISFAIQIVIFLVLGSFAGEFLMFMMSRLGGLMSV